MNIREAAMEAYEAKQAEGAKEDERWAYSFARLASKCFEDWVGEKISFQPSTPDKAFAESAGLVFEAEKGANPIFRVQVGYPDCEHTHWRHITSLADIGRRLAEDRPCPTCAKEEKRRAWALTSSWSDDLIEKVVSAVLERLE